MNSMNVIPERLLMQKHKLTDCPFRELDLRESTSHKFPH